MYIGKKTLSLFAMFSQAIASVKRAGGTPDFHRLRYATVGLQSHSADERARARTEEGNAMLTTTMKPK